MATPDLRAVLRLELALEQFKAAAAEARAIYTASMQGITGAAEQAGAAVDTALSSAGAGAAEGVAQSGGKVVEVLDEIERQADQAGNAITGALDGAGAAATITPAGEKIVQVLGEIEAESVRAGEVIKVALGGAGASARDAGVAIDQAFRTLGIRSTDDLRYEVKSLEQAFDTLKASGVASADDIARAEAALRSRTAELQQQIGGVSASTVNAGAAINEAFSRVGVRSAEQIRAEINAVDQSIQRLALDARVSGADFERAFSAGKTRIAELEAELSGSAAGVKGVGSAATSAVSSLLPLTGAMAALFSAQKFVEANVGMQALDRSLKQIAGSGDAAAKEMEYITGVSNRLGLELISTGKAYVQFMASTQGTALQGEETRRVFEAVAGAMAKLGKSSADTERALVAVGQMASKGTVAMEELKGQLGDALPGALQAAADGAGLTVAQLTKMVENGQVLASDLLPKLADGLQKMYGAGKEVDGFAAQWNRLKNTITETAVTVGKNGVMTAIEKTVGAAGVAVTATSESFGALGKSIGATAAAAAHLDFRGLGDDLARFDNEAATNTLNAARNFGLLAKEADGVAASTTAAGAGTAKSGDSALKAAADYATLLTQAEQTSANLSKLAEARKQEAAAMVTFANAFGTETEKRQAAAAAAQLSARALQDEASARRAELLLVQQRVAQLQQEISSEGAAGAAKQQTLQTAQQALAAKQAEYEKSLQAADAARQEAAARELNAATYADNASKIDVYRAAMESATAEYRQLIQWETQGDASAEEVAAGKEKAAAATALYRDALSDAASAAQRAIVVEQQHASVTQSALSLAKERATSELEIARARGDELGVARAQQSIRDIEIKMLQAQAEASHAEAKAILAAVAAKRAELEATGQLTPAKRAELDAQMAAAKAKELDAEKSDILAQRIRDVASASDQMRGSGKGAADGLTQSLTRAVVVSEQLSESLAHIDEQNAALNANLSAEEQAAGVVKRVGTTQDINYADVARANGLRGDDVQAFADKFGAIFADKMADMRADLSGQIVSTDRYMQEYENYFKQAVEAAKAAAKPTLAGSAKPTNAGSSDTNTASTTHVVQLNAGGKKTSVNVQSADDANALIRALQLAGMTAS